MHTAARAYAGMLMRRLISTGAYDAPLAMVCVDHDMRGACAIAWAGSAVHGARAGCTVQGPVHMHGTRAGFGSVPRGSEARDAAYGSGTGAVWCLLDACW